MPPAQRMTSSLSCQFKRPCETLKVQSVAARLRRERIVMGHFDFMYVFFKRERATPWISLDLLIAQISRCCVFF